jgi:uncharacterized protein YjiS (DUF1127 family)
MPGAHGRDAPIPFEGGLPGRHPPAMRLFACLWRALVAMRTRAELRALSDRTLRDIGLQRREIDSLFR